MKTYILNLSDSASVRVVYHTTFLKEVSVSCEIPEDANCVKVIGTIDFDHIVFDKKSYSFVLENRLNDSNFINEYIFSDCQANAAELLALLQELTEVFAVNLEVGVSIAEEYQRLYS